MPSKLAAADDVQVQVKHRLSCFGVHIKYCSVTLLIHTCLFSEFPGNLKHMREQRGIFDGDIVQGCNVLSGHDQDVNRRLRRDISCVS